MYVPGDTRVGSKIMKSTQRVRSDMDEQAVQKF